MCMSCMQHNPFSVPTRVDRFLLSHVVLKGGGAARGRQQINKCFFASGKYDTFTHAAAVKKF
jgi:hypothetical protein